MQIDLDLPNMLTERSSSARHRRPLAMWHDSRLSSGRLCPSPSFGFRQGHIALDVAVFPEGTPGCALDTLARTPLWREGLNYRHGTGHGVGAALNVHEVSSGPPK